MNILDQIRQIETAITLTTARYVHARTREESASLADSLGKLYIRLEKLRAENERGLR